MHEGKNMGIMTTLKKPTAERGGAPQPVRRFGTFTADLDALADWLIACGVTTGAMESTGVYWIPLFAL